MPPPPGIGASFFSSGMSLMSASVVRSSDAMDDAFWRAERTTFAGSMTPAFTRFSYVSVSALKPYASFSSRIFCTTIEPSWPAFVAIQRIGSSRRCCIDRTRPTTDSYKRARSTIDAIRLGSPELGHPVQDLARENGFGGLPCWGARPKPRRVKKPERVVPEQFRGAPAQAWTGQSVSWILTGVPNEGSIRSGDGLEDHAGVRHGLGR